VFADSPYQPINAKMNWTSNGNFAKIDNAPVKVVNNGYYTSTSVITVDANGPSTYTCNATFAKPSVQFMYVAENTPEFSASCDVIGKTQNVKQSVSVYSFNTR